PYTTLFRSHRVVDGTDVLPHEDVALLPVKGVAVLGLQLVREQELEHLLAFLLRQLVDPDRVAGIGVENAAPGDRVREKNRVRHRRLRRLLRFGERRTRTASAAPDFPALVEPVQ